MCTNKPECAYVCVCVCVFPVVERRQLGLTSDGDDVHDRVSCYCEARQLPMPVHTDDDGKGLWDQGPSLQVQAL